MSEIFFGQKNFGRKFFLVGKNCGQKKHIVGGGKIGQKKKFGQKKDVGQNFFWLETKFWSKNLSGRNFF